MRNIPYGRHFIDRSDIKAVTAVLKSDWITQGPKIREFEGALCERTGAKYAVAVSSGTAALHLACLASGITSGDEVITSPITFVASANCILYCGGRPVFADVQKDTLNINPDEIKRHISKKTKALICIHFAGHPVDLKEIHSIAQKHNLIVIEDAAHALGAVYKNSKIGSCKYSDIAIFSFHPVKAVTTGEGGAILTNRKDLYEKLLMLRSHGITKDVSRFTCRDSKMTGPWYYEQQYLGFNYRITDIQCSLGLSQLKKLDGFLEKRRKLVDTYNEALCDINAIILPKEKPYVKSAWHLYYIRLRSASKRKALFEQLLKSGIGAQVHYIPVHLQPYYRKNFSYKPGDFPQAEHYYESTITLPLYPQMTKSDIQYVIKVLKGHL